MADIKTLIVKVPEISENTGLGCQEALRKGAFFASYAPGPFMESAEPEALKGAQASSVAQALERLKNGSGLTWLELAGPDFDQGLFELLGQSDRRTVIAVVSESSLAFYGLGIDSKAKPKARATSADVLPTLAQVGEFYLGDNVQGNVLFEALKNKNFKQSQIARLKAALDRLEKMIKRENREPWDKHDCA
ncbi:MAG: hypothetical protein LBU69_06550 [Deltaproteobacteria bacterium]|jgi:hypothetical protein|nr:hypothetical protein [Deltaproteobacteria bacterium]